MATERIIEHIDRLRQKPEHIRHRIAMGTAFAVTGLVAITWMGAMATSGTLALKQGTAEEGANGESLSESLKEPASAFTSLLGAAGAAFNATSTEAALTIIETRTSSTLDAKSSSDTAVGKTVIPF